MGKHAKLKEKRKWSNEKIHLQNARKLRGIYFIHPEDTEFKETIKNARKKLETWVAPSMPGKFRKIVGVVYPTTIQTKLAWILEANESTRMRMWNSIPQNHEDHIAEKGEIHYSTTIWFTNLFLCLKLWKFRQQKQRWTRNGKISAWNLTKVKSKKQVIDEARTSGATVHLASLMDICHLKNAELEAKDQKYKGRVVFRGDIVKDDSGSYAVLTEQGSSASQMTAAKIMNIISRLPGCDGQAADAVSAYTQGKWKMLTNCWKFPNRSVQTFGFVYHDQMAYIMVQYGRPICSSWKESLRSSFGRTVMGKAIWENPFETWPGEIPNKECLLFTVKKDYSYLCMWMTKLDGEKILIRCGKYSTKKSIWENQHLSWIMYTWDALKENSK